MTNNKTKYSFDQIPNTDFEWILSYSTKESSGMSSGLPLQIYQNVGKHQYLLPTKVKVT
jgi:hypothetical protein